MRVACSHTPHTASVNSSTSVHRTDYSRKFARSYRKVGLNLSQNPKVSTAMNSSTSLTRSSTKATTTHKAQIAKPKIFGTTRQEFFDKDRQSSACASLHPHNTSDFKVTTFRLRYLVEHPTLAKHKVFAKRYNGNPMF